MSFTFSADSIRPSASMMYVMRSAYLASGSVHAP
jgi:hypothetical protein